MIPNDKKEKLHVQGFIQLELKKKLKYHTLSTKQLSSYANNKIFSQLYCGHIYQIDLAPLEVKPYIKPIDRVHETIRISSPIYRHIQIQCAINGNSSVIVILKVKHGLDLK